MKNPHEVIWILETDPCGDFVNFQTGLFQEPACLPDFPFPDGESGRQGKKSVPAPQKGPVGHSVVPGQSLQIRILRKMQIQIGCNQINGFIRPVTVSVLKGGGKLNFLDHAHPAGVKAVRFSRVTDFPAVLIDLIEDSAQIEIRAERREHMLRRSEEAEIRKSLRRIGDVDFFHRF